MAFLSGPVSFQRFFVGGKLPRDVDDSFVRALARHAFGTSPAGRDGVQVGWIGPGHLFETEIAAERIAFGRFVVLGMRTDRLSPPANVLRGYIRMEEEAALSSSGREYLSKSERRAAREAALARAEQESRVGAFRRMSASPVMMDLERRVVYLGGAGVAAADRLLQLFRDTFGAYLEAATADALATRRMLAAKTERKLENLQAARFVSPPEGAQDRGFDAARELTFLGREFLTWLWHRISQEEPGLRLSHGDEVTVAIDRSLRLRCDFGLTGATTISADAPTHLPEAAAALSIGKQPVRAGLVVGGALGELRCTLDATRMSVSGLVLPEDRSPEDARTRLERRLELIADVAELIDGLFELFLTERTGREWSAIERTIAAWVGGVAYPSKNGSRRAAGQNGHANSDRARATTA